VSAAATYEVTVHPFYQNGVRTVFTAYDDHGQLLQSLRHAIVGPEPTVYEFPLPVGTYRFHAWSLASLQLCGISGCASLPLSFYGVVDLTASVNSGRVSGTIDVSLNCDPGTRPGGTCNESPDSDSDGVPDDQDGCPDDPDKVEPGECGCGHPEAPDCASDASRETETNNFQNANRLTFSGETAAMRGTISFNDTEDWFQFSAAEGNTVTLQVKRFAECICIALYDPSVEQLVSAGEEFYHEAELIDYCLWPDRSDEFSSSPITLLQGGTYYIRVSICESSEGNYSFILSRR